MSHPTSTDSVPVGSSGAGPWGGPSCASVSPPGAGGRCPLSGRAERKGPHCHYLGTVTWGRGASMGQGPSSPISDPPRALGWGSQGSREPPVWGHGDICAGTAGVCRGQSVPVMASPAPRWLPAVTRPQRLRPAMVSRGHGGRGGALRLPRHPRLSCPRWGDSSPGWGWGSGLGTRVVRVLGTWVGAGDTLVAMG